uniref:hypothetical protein n=1 Tax=Bacillus siamensis TaxID=659243 RepID=UPI003D818FE1
MPPADPEATAALFLAISLRVNDDGSSKEAEMRPKSAGRISANRMPACAGIFSYLLFVRFFVFVSQTPLNRQHELPGALACHIQHRV